MERTESVAEERMAPRRRYWKSRYGGSSPWITRRKPWPRRTLGGLLRREGLYSSHLSTWRRQRDEAAVPAERELGVSDEASKPLQLLNRIEQRRCSFIRGIRGRCHLLLQLGRLLQRRRSTT